MSKNETSFGFVHLTLQSNPTDLWNIVVPSFTFLFLQFDGNSTYSTLLDTLHKMGNKPFQVHKYNNQMSWCFIIIIIIIVNIILFEEVSKHTCTVQTKLPVTCKKNYFTTMPLLLKELSQRISIVLATYRTGLEKSAIYSSNLGWVDFFPAGQIYFHCYLPNG